MGTVETLILTFHVLVALVVVGLVLIQHGKGADMGAGFGAGASATVVGSGGAGNFLTRTTTIIVVSFYLTSIGLAYYAKRESQALRSLGIPDAVEAGSESQGTPGALTIDPETLSSGAPQMQVIRPEGPDGPAYNVQISTSVQPAEPEASQESPEAESPGADSPEAESTESESAAESPDSPEG